MTLPAGWFTTAVTDISRDPIVQRLREQISANDRAIIEGLNCRIELVAELRAHKLASGYELLDPARESWLVEHLASSNRGQLSAEGLREFVLALLDLTKREVARKSSSATTRPRSPQA